MPYYRRMILNFDGASRNNPRGPAGCGWTLYEMDENGARGGHIAENGDYMGYNFSNNQAEYKGLILGLAYIMNSKIRCDTLYIRGDAQIVIRQMEGEYQVRSQNIVDYYNVAVELLNRIKYDSADNCIFRHISRDNNWEADRLANEAIDNHS